LTVELEVLVHDAGNLVARHRNVVIQVRSGDMTPAILQRIESAALLARASAGGSVGAVAIIEDGASLASAEVRKEQAAVVRRLLRDPRTHFVTVIAGDTVANRAINSVMRLLLLGVPRLRSVSTIEEAIAWLVAHVEGVAASELRAAIEDARTRLRS
jgi:hypothetical protein